MDIGTIVVFFAPKQGKWVIRQYDKATSLRLGDTFWNGDNEPTDAELKTRYGDAVRIHRGYAV